MERVRLNTQTKVCSKCKGEKQLNEFYKNKTCKYGVGSNCKQCKRHYMVTYEQVDKERKSKYYKNYKNKNKKNRNGYSRMKYKSDIQYRLKNIITTYINYHLKKNNLNKKHKSLKYLGCSIQEYKQYLESQFTPEMNWENYGSYWEIDHIKPTSKFNIIDGGQQLKAFNWENPQPLTIDENRNKSNKF